jgi:hypothetical protein
VLLSAEQAPVRRDRGEFNEYTANAARPKRGADARSDLRY